MGIDGLLPVLKPEVIIGHISKFQNKTAAIDARSWLYRGAYSCAYQLTTKQPTDAYLLYIYKMLMALKKWSIKPIMCIDGIPVMAKSKTIEARKVIKENNKKKGLELYEKGDTEAANKCFSKCLKIGKKMIYRLVDMLITMGVEYYLGPYEADSQIAFLCRNGLADFAISEDSDMLCYNCPQVVYKLTMHGECEYVDLADLRKKRADKVKLANEYLNILLKLSEEEFTKICIIAGCDYLPSIKGMGLKKALKYYDRFRNIDSIVRRLSVEKTFRDHIPPQYEAMFNRIATLFYHPLVFDPIQRKLVTLHPCEDPEALVRENSYFIGDFFDQAEDVVKGKIHMKTFQPRTIEPFDLNHLVRYRDPNESKPTTKDYITIARQEMKNNDRYQREHQTQEPQSQASGGKDSLTKDKPKILVTAPQEKKQEFLDLDNLVNVDIDALYYPDDFEIEQNFNSPSKYSPSKKLDKEDDELEEKIDFLFDICKEYANGMEQKSKKNEIIEISVEKSPTFHGQKEKEPKPVMISQLLKTQTQTQDDRYSFMSTLEPTIQEEEEDQVIDSFKKLKDLGKKSVSTKATPSQMYTPIQSQSVQASPIVSKSPISSAIKPLKRKFVDWDYTTSQNPTPSLDMFSDFMRGPNAQQTKKIKENPSSSSKLDSNTQKSKIKDYFSNKKE